MGNIYGRKSTEPKWGIPICIDQFQIIVQILLAAMVVSLMVACSSPFDSQVAAVESPEETNPSNANIQTATLSVIREQPTVPTELPSIETTVLPPSTPTWSGLATIDNIILHQLPEGKIAFYNVIVDELFLMNAEGLSQLTSDKQVNLYPSANLSPTEEKIALAERQQDWSYNIYVTLRSG